MQKLVAPACLVLGLASCLTPAAPADTVGNQNKEVVMKFNDAAAKGDTASLEGFLAEKCMIYGPGLNDSINRQQEVDFWKKSWRTEFSSLTYDRAAIIAFTLPPDHKFPGDWVSDWGTWSIQYKNGSPNVSFAINVVAKVNDGKIEVARTFYDENDFFKQQGFTVTPPAVPGDGAKK